MAEILSCSNAYNNEGTKVQTLGTVVQAEVIVLSQYVQKKEKPAHRGFKWEKNEKNLHTGNFNGKKTEHRRLQWKKKLR